MKRNNSIKIMYVMLYFIVLVLIGVIILFLIHVCNKTAKLTDVDIVDISDKNGEIVALKMPEKIEEEEEIIIKVELPYNTNVENYNERDNSNQNENQPDNNETIIDKNSGKYYYNQLNKYSQSIYKSLDQQKGKFKLGNKYITLPLGIGKVLDEEDGENQLKAVFTIAMNAFQSDNPDIFYVDMSKIILYYEGNSHGDYRMYLTKDDKYDNYFIDGINSESDVSNYINEIDSIEQEIEENINKKNLDTDYKKILYVHDWIINNSKYDKSLKETNKNNIYGILKEGKAVCEGYAKAFKYLMDKLNINCMIVYGKGTNNNITENHAWNYVEIEGKWYGIDCTWDDPVVINPDGTQGEQMLSHKYFLKGQNVFDSSHKPSKTFYGTNIEINYPKLSVDNYKKKL